MRNYLVEYRGNDWTVRADTPQTALKIATIKYQITSPGDATVWEEENVDGILEHIQVLK